MTSWDKIYEWHMKRGSDHGAAAFAADEWEKRERREHHQGSKKDKDDGTEITF